MDTVQFMELISKYLAEAKRFGLESEVLTWALRDLCKDDERILQALQYGLDEWVK